MIFWFRPKLGWPQITGAPEQPGRVGVSICDIAAGMTAHAGDSAGSGGARQRTGEGRGYRSVAVPCAWPTG